MPDDIDLNAEVRRLLEVEAPIDPTAAAVQFDALVATYGQATLGAALVAVASREVLDLLGAAPQTSRPR